jgi:PAP2 superfamily protein
VRPPKISWSDKREPLLREHLPLLVTVAVVIAAGYLAEALSGLHSQMRHLWSWGGAHRYFIGALMVPLPFMFLVLRLRERDAQGVWISGRPGWEKAWQGFRWQHLNPQATIRALLVALCLSAMIDVSGAWKLAIPKLHTFSWDARLAAFDATLHLGKHPWEWLQPIVGTPAVTSALDLIYFTWHPLVALGVAWFAWSRHPLRMQFLVSFVLVWLLLGNVMATVFSSAGPCYFGRVAQGPNPYAPLVGYLHLAGAKFPVLSLAVQERLWQNYAGTLHDQYSGISAFPSIHVAIPFLFAIATWQMARTLSIVAAAYTGLILIGSIHLGWHYAVDGYSSLLGVIALWWSVGRILTALYSRRHSEAEGP